MGLAKFFDTLNSISILTYHHIVQLLVSHVSNITWNQEAFKNLILPKQYKELLLTLVRSKMENKDIFDDHIEGKGTCVRWNNVCVSESLPAA